MGGESSKSNTPKPEIRKPRSSSFIKSEVRRTLVETAPNSSVLVNQGQYIRKTNIANNAITNTGTRPFTSNNTGTSNTNAASTTRTVTPSNIGATASTTRTVAPSNIGATASTTRIVAPSNIGATASTTRTVAPSNIGATASTTRTVAPSNIDATASTTRTVAPSNIGATASTTRTVAPSNIGATASTTRTVAPSNIGATASTTGTVAPSNNTTTASPTKTVNDLKVPNDTIVKCNATENGKNTDNSAFDNINKNIDKTSYVKNLTNRKDRDSLTTNDNDPLFHHNKFFKKIIGSFNLKEWKSNRGIYCDLCKWFDVFHRVRQPRHDASQMHKNKMESSPGVEIKYYWCKSCRCEFNGDINFYLYHIDSHFHKVLLEVKQNESSSKNKSDYGRRKKHSKHSSQQDLQKSLSSMDITELERVDIFSVLKEQAESEDNKSVAESNTTNQKYTLVLNDLALSVTRNDVFEFAKDFGRIDKVVMAHKKATVFFKKRFVAKNIIDNNIPLAFKGQFVKMELSVEL